MPRGMPYVRREYIDGVPQSKISKFTMGNPNGQYDYKVELISKERVQIRHNALEAMRTAANKLLATELGETNYFLVLKVYPHIILRENKMIATAGADRLQEGMRRSFGKPIGLAARVRPGQVLMEAYVTMQGVETAKQAFNVAKSKIPTPTLINVAPVIRRTEAS
jgi:large subunit ribosomal protein L10e